MSGIAQPPKPRGTPTHEEGRKGQVRAICDREQMRGSEERTGKGKTSGNR